MQLANNIKISDPWSVMLPYAEEITSAVDRVIKSGWYIGGKEVLNFENEFSEYLNINHTIGTGSGTDALQLALRSIGIKAGDKVATVSHTAVATVVAIEMVGAIPVFVDVNPETFTIDIECLRETLESHNSNLLDSIKAIVPVHIYGHPANMKEIMSLAQKYDALVIEDCAQAHGAAINYKKCGTWGHAAAFSFYPTKNLGCLGDGGAMVTNDSIVFEKAKLLREYGWKERYISEIPGINTRLDAIQAAVLRVRLNYLDSENAIRIINSEKLNVRLKKTRLILPIVKVDYKSVFYQYVIRTTNRDYQIQELIEIGRAHV